MPTEAAIEIAIARGDGFYRVRYNAMACGCEILVQTDDRELARRLGRLAADETARIERKFSRYRPDNIVHAINHADGRAVRVDAETADLLDYAATCHELSNGLFDITSGVLRRLWRFDGSDRLPEAVAVAGLLGKVGWQRVDWQRPRIRLPPGMEIDLGGIGKEYAVDRCVERLREHTDCACLVNFGGDLRASRRRRDHQPWRVGVDTADAPGTPSRVIELGQGALATSGDSNRFLLKNGVRYGHLLDPRTGWPVAGGPRSVTVAATLCIEAGMLSSLALLHGPDAERFLAQQNARYWCDWGSR